MIRIDKYQTCCINCKYYTIHKRQCNKNNKPNNPLSVCASFSKIIKNKYNAIQTMVGNFIFHSILESKRYLQLLRLQKVGEVGFFLRQVPFHLHDGTVYRVDFDITYKDGTRTFEDVKGILTAVARLKIKMVEDQYPVKIIINKMGKK